ncbi:hypothetical protein GGX14DRAFT_417731, partial [Mycena pura]
MDDPPQGFDTMDGSLGAAEMHDIDSQIQESNGTSNCPQADLDSEILEIDTNVGSNNWDSAQRLQSRAMSFGYRYLRLGDLGDLKAALQYFQQAVDFTSQHHPEKARRLKSLVISFTDQYRRLGDVKNLARSFGYPYRRLGDLKDHECVHLNYNASLACPVSSPKNSWHAALRWASIAKNTQAQPENTQL